MTSLWITDPDDERLPAAHANTCNICGAKPEQPCKPTMGDKLLRIVHLERVGER